MDGFGLLAAFTALIGWGFGDFYIQKTTRLVGSIKVLLYICVFGTVAIFPFIRSEIIPTFSRPHDLFILTVASIILFFSALFLFEGLKKGKIAIVEPVFALELPFTILLGVGFLGEQTTTPQKIAMGLVFIGIVLVMTKRRIVFKNHQGIFERGILFAGVGAIIMALANVTVGVASQETGALFTIWFTSLFLVIPCIAILALKGELRLIGKDIQKNARPILIVSALDNLAWIGYAYATTKLPISITITISEAYIIIAVLLGVFVNREKLRRHQTIGAACAIVGVLALSYLTEM